MQMEKLGAKITFGARFFLNDKDDAKLGVFLDIYGGIGIQQLNRSVTTHAIKLGTCDIYDNKYAFEILNTPEITNTNLYRGTAHIGLMFGFAF